jgi:hypothetical protein
MGTGTGLLWLCFLLYRLWPAPVPIFCSLYANFLSSFNYGFGGVG